VWLIVSTATAADHGDMPILAGFGRSDSQLTDLFVFPSGDDLVIALCIDPAVPPGVTSYVFSSDLELTLHIDSHSKVDYANVENALLYGGTVATPQGIAADKSITITFDHNGAPQVKATGIARKDRDRMQVFAGLRDDPFIRRPRKGRNVAAVVVQLPLKAIAGPRETLLVWGTSTVPTPLGPMGDHAGRALRSMFIGEMNLMTPKQQFLQLGVEPDVVIYNTSLPAGFPNGRLLTDDVNDLALDNPGGTLPGEGTDFPTANDVPFLGTFPYLAPPQ
jgi:hypothetical protein